MGDGGMCVTSDPATADRLRLLAGHGMRPRYYHQAIGINSRLDTFQAAVLRVKFARLGDAIAARSRIAARYTRLIQEAGLADTLVTPVKDAASFHVWNQYALRVPDGRRDELRSHLAEHGVGSEIYYPVPMHQQECFADVPFRMGDLSRTEKAAAEVLNLPIFPTLTPDEQARVVAGLSSFYAAEVRMVA